MFRLRIKLLSHERDRLRRASTHGDFGVLILIVRVFFDNHSSDVIRFHFEQFRGDICTDTVTFAQHRINKHSHRRRSGTFQSHGWKPLGISLKLGE
jgi:hypothetical protein